MNIQCYILASVQDKYLNNFFFQIMQPIPECALGADLYFKLWLKKLPFQLKLWLFEDPIYCFTLIVLRRMTICWYLVHIILHSVTRQCPSLDTAAILWEFAAWRHLVLHCAEEAGKSPVMVVRGLEVGIKPSLSACSVPLIRWLASAMQWTRWKVFDWQNWSCRLCSVATERNKQTYNETQRNN